MGEDGIGGMGSGMQNKMAGGRDYMQELMSCEQEGTPYTWEELRWELTGGDLRRIAALHQIDLSGVPGGWKSKHQTAVRIAEALGIEVPKKKKKKKRGPS
jgi:hypothetical protein